MRGEEVGAEMNACCAHLRVEWVTSANLDGSTTGKWVCKSCEIPFVPTRKRWVVDASSTVEKGRIIQALATFLRASYADELPSDALRDHWRHVASDARFELDELEGRAEKAEARVVELEAKSALATASWKAAEEELQTVAREAAVAALRYLQTLYAVRYHVTIGHLESGALKFNAATRKWEAK